MISATYFCDRCGQDAAPGHRCDPDDVALLDRVRHARQNRQDRDREPTFAERLSVGFAMLSDDADGIRL